jgi:hypothetical protein
MSKLINFVVFLKQKIYVILNIVLILNEYKLNQQNQLKLLYINITQVN